MPFTQQQLEASGYSLVMGAGHRVQIWTGADANGEGVMVAWDSVTGRRRRLPDVGSSPLELMRALLAICVVLDELLQVSAWPASAAGRNALRKVLGDALQGD